MTPASFVVLHGFGPEITLLEYLFRVVLYLFTFGGVAAIVFLGLDVVRTIHSGGVEKGDGGEDNL